MVKNGILSLSFFLCELKFFGVSDLDPDAESQIFLFKTRS